MQHPTTQDDDWHALAGGRSRPEATTPTARGGGSKYTGGAFPTPPCAPNGPILIAVDTVAATIGIICVFIILLALGTDAFAYTYDPYSDDAGSSAAVAASQHHQQQQHGSGDNNNSTSLISIPNVPRKLHALLQGTVGEHVLLKAIQARAERRRVAKETRKRAKLDEGSFSSLFSSPTAADAVKEVEAMLARDESRTAGDDGAPDTRSIMGSMGHMGDAERRVFDDDASFFMSISQFKDVLCPNTIAEIYAKARNPRRIFAGIVDQRDPNLNETAGGVGHPTDAVVKRTNLDGTCFPWYMMSACRTMDFCPTDNIRVRHALPREGKGPTWGRYYGMLMYQGEAYYMMIDSHSRFVHHWDAQSVLNLHLLPKTTKKAVISHYPSGFESYYQLLSQRKEVYRMVMCSAHYTAAGIIRMDSQALPSGGFPEMHAFSAGGYVFGDAQFVHEVPFDPYLYYVFDGEEILYSVRLWTHGFDLFTPKNNILFHHYARHGAPRFWSIPGLKYAAAQQLGQARVKYFMRSLKNQTHVRMVTDEWARNHKVDIEEDIYGLGKARSLEDYYRFAHVDPVKWTVSNDYCHNVRDRKTHRNKYHAKMSYIDG